MADEEKNEVVEETTMETETVDSKAEKFKALATKRVNDVCKKIINIGKLANKSSYHYTEEEVNKIFDVITSQVENAKAKFSATKGDSNDTKDFIQF